MGRSKFPGKPSKQCYRKRVNVLPKDDEPADNNSRTVTRAQDKGQEDSADLDSESEYEDVSEGSPSSPFQENTRSADKPRQQLNNALRKNTRKRNFITKVRSKAVLSSSVANRRGAISKRQNIKLKRRESTKFVLPTRSVHSSRVIKPNKRFIELNEGLCVKRRIEQHDDQDREIKTSEKAIDDPSEKDKLTFTNGHRVILRQARLKLPIELGKQGPFSTKLDNGPGTIICGVCGAVRYYRFVQQARKFNIYSCEACRKFVSKQIKRQNVGGKHSTTVLPCHLGQGACYISSAMRSQHWKITKCAYKSRCPACWLKMCLKSYQLPQTLKQNLTQMLPRNMRGLDFTFSNTLPPILWQRNVENREDTNNLNVNQRPIRFKVQKAPNPTVANSEIKRQKVDIKGPRVKHVCRSASIVLGQPIARFEREFSQEKEQSDKKEDTEEELKSLIDDVEKKEDPEQDPGTTSDEDLTTSTGISKIYLDKSAISRAERVQNFLNSSISEDCLSQISDDDDEDKILVDYPTELNYRNNCKQGFALIGSERFSVESVCFLCGSAGLDSMLVCALCCEPYHSFCVDDFLMDSNCSTMIDWICARCTPCEGCKCVEKQKTNCPKCRKCYHSECLSSVEGSNRILCKECTKCQNCNTPMPDCNFLFPANRPLCQKCIEDKKPGNYCPICRKTFEDSNLLKVVQCLKCNKWIHSECEKLTSDQYDILKLLPSSSDFTCSSCLSDGDVTWHKKLQTEICLSLSNVIKLLGKNKNVKSKFKSNIQSLLKTPLHADIDNNNCDKDFPSVISSKTLLSIKGRVCTYSSVKQFDDDVTEVLQNLGAEIIIYKNILQTIFPWYNRNEPKITHFSHTSHHHSDFNEKHKNTLSVLPPREKDYRSCALCKKTGDGLVTHESRLLYCGQNTWIHANCAYWSSEVYEEIDNHLQNVLKTIENSQGAWCLICRNSGASIWCTVCKTDRVHFLCARRANWTFARIRKVCFCPKHSPPPDEQISVIEHDFIINRSVFIEQTNEKGIRQLADKVACTVGSLSITKLGKIEPIISDTLDAIIPAGFVCSRVFWSTLEPWRLVPFIITTSVQNPNCNTLTVDKNFTIDHTLPKIDVEKIIKDLSVWQREHEKKEVSSDTEDDEEKNGGELLSPELTDTILKDLPHDLLDGISVQDIFPNFTYEDVLSMDNSNAESLVECFKKVDDEESLDAVKEWTKNKFDSKIERISRMPALNHLTLSYKLDSPLPNIMASAKKRPGNSMPLLLQVDGNFDDDSDDCHSPSQMITFNPWPEEPVTCEKCQSTYRTQASYKRHLDSCEVFCSSESESENVAEIEYDETGTENPNNHQIMHMSEPYQDVVISSFESHQSQVQTAMVNVVPETQPVSIHQNVALPESTNNSTMSIPIPICVGTPLVQHTIDYQTASTPQVSLQSVVLPRLQTVRPDPSNSVIVQPLHANRPTQSFVPILDSFQQAPATQNMQYLATIAPQQVAVPTQQLVHILPSIQPTVILQQPQQLILDGNGTLSWAQPTHQPVYYGFETIVQNTVMQSQQFLPSAVPGMLTANSSYSTTTQVFQTSKLEPVIDMSSNSFLLVNSNGQVELSQLSQAPNNLLQAQSTPTMIYSQMPVPQKALPTSNNCISLPSTPFVSDHGIPMNIVPPIPKAPASHNRPMSRVLPMPTKQPKAIKNNFIDETKKFIDEKSIDKVPQLKFEDKKKLLSKDFLKTIYQTKIKNKKVDIVDYKIVKSCNNIKTSPEAVKLKSPTSLKEFEPAEKIPKFSNSNAIAERVIEQVKLQIFKKPAKLLQQLEPAKLLQQLEDQKCVKIGNIDLFEKCHKDVKEPKASMPNIFHTDSENKQSNKVNKSLNLISKPVEKEEIENQKPSEYKKSNCEKEIHQDIDYKFISTKQSAMIAALRPLRTQSLQNKEDEKQDKKSTKEDMGCPKTPLKKDIEKPHAPPSVLYTIENREGFKYSSTSITECWGKVLDAVQKARAAHNMPSLPISDGKMKSIQLLGLKSSHIRYLVEQLPEASKCVKYKPLFKFIPNEQINVKDSRLGSARNEPWKRKNHEPYDMFSWLCSRHRQPFNISEDQQTIQSRRVNNLPMAMKFRNLKYTSKFSVGVYRSNIHGRGLFCLRDIDPGEMVIEYAGEVIRSILTDKREKLYNSKGIGCYMFRVDDNFVVDATMKGNAARFINHSCDPNCYSKVVEILGHKHIIIFALRRILRGEELTYDYKFPFEEDKIPCTCGAKRCRKFLN